MPAWRGYHTKTDGRAYFRFYIPTDLKDHLGPFPMVNLGLKKSKAAERLALMHYIAFQGLIADKRGELAAESLRPRPRPLGEYSEEDRVAFAVQLAQGFNREEHKALRGFAPRGQLLEMHDLLTAIARDVLTGRGPDGLAKVTALFLTAAGTPHRTDEPAFRSLVFEFATALDGEFIKPSSRRLHEGEAVPPPPLPVPPTALVKVAPALTLGTVIADYLEVIRRSPNGYTRKVVRCLQLFGSMLGEQTPVIQLRQKQVTGFLHDICCLPSDWAQRFDQGEAIAKMLAGEVEEVMAPKTYTQSYRAPLKKFLAASRRDYQEDGFPELVTEGIDYTGDRVSGEDVQRDLTTAELKRLFEGAEFAAIARNPDAAAAYWLPVIGLYTGARPREICQVNPQCDWGLEEGIHYLQFDQHTPAGKGVKKTVKTGEARRVPMHSELVRLGLPAYLDRMKVNGADRMFPGARTKKGNPFEVAGEAFTEFLKGLDLYDNTAPPGRRVLGMYVFRKTFITYAGNQSIPTFGMTGHKPEHMTQVQWKSYCMSQAALKLVQTDLERVTFPIVIPNRSTF
jgi:integrase